MKMANKFFLYLHLIRIQSPAGYMLLFWPASFGLLLSGNIHGIYLMPLFFVASIIIRSAGCIINDLIDKDLDAKVKRTCNRPLANRQLSIFDALKLLMILLAISLFILLSLTNTSIIIGFVAFIMIIFYPFMKRITYFPQVFLGATFNLGVLIAYSSITNSISLESLTLYVACCFWTIVYDTIYGFMDIKYDKQIGVKSIPRLLENRHCKIWLFSSYAIFLLLFVIATYNTSMIYIALMVLASIVLMWQILTLNINIAENCLLRFKNNVYVGAIFFLALFMSQFINI
ncbi:MAG: 4-hydroxybenzoate octaprenyltransferase [Rickettsiaceae bacterium]